MEIPIELSLNSFQSIANLSPPTHFSSVALSAFTTTTTTTPKLVVIKSILKSWSSRFCYHQSPSTELRILFLSRSLSNPPIPLLLASFLSPSHFHLVLDLAQGGDLASVLDNHQRGLDEDCVKRWMAELVLAVEWLHSNHYAHRDLKPSNFLLSSTGRLLLSDFGSAAPISYTSSSANTPFIAARYAAALAGTPDYIAPEILKFAESRAAQPEGDEHSSLFQENQQKMYRLARDLVESAYGPEVDWWSFGVCVYELLTAQTPFFTETIEGTYDLIINCPETLSFPSYLSSQAQAFLVQLLAPPSKRYTTSGQLKAHLWFSKINWKTLSSQPSLYIPPPFIPPLAPDCPANFSTGNSNNSKIFNFSAFFSSPGLSILRSSPICSRKDQQEDIWNEMEIGFREQDFDALLDWVPVVKKRSQVEKIKVVDHFFQTPVRGATISDNGSRSGNGGGSGCGDANATGTESSSRRRRRGSLNQVDAWKVMQEHAWCVGLTAKKGGNRKVFSPMHSPDTQDGNEKIEVEDGLKILEERQKGVLDQLDGLEDRYRNLFALARQVNDG